MTSNLIHKLRSLFFSPDSKFELWARSLYHRISSTKLHFHLQDWLARLSYRRWINRQRKEKLPEPDPKFEPPIITFLVDCQNVEDQLSTTLNSLQNLQNGRWQALLVSRTGEIPEKITIPDTAHHQIGVFNQKESSLLENIHGEFVIFCKAGDRFFPSMLHRFYLRLAQIRDIDLAYYDCEIQGLDGSFPAPLFKPQTPSPAVCLSYNMFSRAFFRTSLLNKTFTKSDKVSDLLLKEYELSLKCLEDGTKILHIPAVLVSQTDLVKPDSSETQQIVSAYLSRSDVEDPSAEIKTLGTRFNWSHKIPTLAIVIPSKNNARLLRPLIQSILENRHDHKLTINIVDNHSDEPETLAYYKEIASEPLIRILPYYKPFNYSETINLGVSETDSDLILLLNDDMEPVDSAWLSEMIQWAIRPEIGVVGAKLLRANHTLQHAGIIIGLVGYVGHIYLNAPEHYFGLWGSADWYRDILAVTGACQMMRREVFEEVGGYDEGFQLAFGDIDFCLRVHQQGYRNIYTPFARFYHYEGSSRGYQTPVGDVVRGYKKFGNYLSHPDPYYSPHLTYTRIPKCSPDPFSEEDRKANIQARKKFYIKNT